jgi:hypothetical protein
MRDATGPKGRGGGDRGGYDLLKGRLISWVNPRFSFFLRWYCLDSKSESGSESDPPQGPLRAMQGALWIVDSVGLQFQWASSGEGNFALALARPIEISLALFKDSRGIGSIRLDMALVSEPQGPLRAIQGAFIARQIECDSRRLERKCATKARSINQGVLYITIIYM